MNRISSCAVVVGLLVASSSVFAGGRGGVSSSSPGHEFQSPGTFGSQSVAGPGASGYAPGRRYLEDRKESSTAKDTDVDPKGTGPGASIYAPGFLK